MSKNNIDANNERVLQDMEDIISNSGTPENGEGDNDDNMNDGGNNNNGLLRKMLLPLYRIKTRNANALSQFSQFSQPDGDNSHNNENGETIVEESSSLIKVLLRIDILQPMLLRVLLHKLPELAASASSSTACEENEDIRIPKLILSNMKWLDHIINYTELSTSFAECLTLLSSCSSECNVTRGILL